MTIPRYAELGGGLGALGDRVAERIVAQFELRQAQRDLAALMALFGPEVAFVDHRRMAWDQSSGWDAVEHFFRSAFETFPAYWVEVDEVLACDERVIAMWTTTRGLGMDSAGRFELCLGAVVRCANGLIAFWDQYDHDDRAAMLACFAELASSERPPLRPWESFDLLYNQRRLDELHDLYTEDYVMVDRRTLSWEEIEGSAALVATCESFIELAPDMRSRCEVVAEAPGFC